jgi:Domain of unknown function (DUF3854)
MSALLESDIRALKQFGICTERLNWERVDDREARTVLSLNGASGDFGGILIPYIDPRSGRRVTARVRRDHPDIENGKPTRKYVAAWGDKKHLYFPAGANLEDKSITAVMVEAEKSAEALVDWSIKNGKPLLPVATGGVWGWRGRTGKELRPNGTTADEKGVIADLDLIHDREVVILFDSNVAKRSDLRRARLQLARELVARGCKVRIANIPDIDGANGPDDLIKISGDAVLTESLDAAQLFSEVAVADLDRLIGRLSEQSRPQEEDINQACELIAYIGTDTSRELLIGRLAKAVRTYFSKASIKNLIDLKRKEIGAAAEEVVEKAHSAALRGMRIDPAQLIGDIETYLKSMAFLPEHASIVLSVFALNTHVFDVFSTTPYISMESAVPGCGKTTVASLLRICKRPRFAVGLNAANLYRIVHEEHPTLFIDEAESIEGKSESAQALRPVAHVGYKRGAQVPRQVGEGKDMRTEWFDVYCPKVFAAIGGLTGALLDRTITIHMEKPPDGTELLTSEEDFVEQDASPFRKPVEAYAAQARSHLEKIYRGRPRTGLYPNIKHRESEIWTPLLVHGKFAGTEIEKRLLAAQAHFSDAKIKIQTSSDWNTSLAVELLEAIMATDKNNKTFRPVDIVGRIREGDSWGQKLAKYSDDEKGRRLMATSIGRFLGTRFRLDAVRQEGGSAYYRQTAIDVISRHTPQGGARGASQPNVSNDLGDDGTSDVQADVQATCKRSQTVENTHQAGTSGTSGTSTGGSEAYIEDSAEAVEKLFREINRAGAEGDQQEFTEEELSVVSSDSEVGEEL